MGNWKQEYESVSRDLNRYPLDIFVAFQGYPFQEQLTALDAHLQEQLYLNSRQIGDYLFEHYEPEAQLAFEAATKAYKRKDALNKLKIHIPPNAPHRLHPEQIDMMFEWISKWL